LSNLKQIITSNSTSKHFHYNLPKTLVSSVGYNSTLRQDSKYTLDSTYHIIINCLHPLESL
jgi:hypothetical protein